jgi:hypothetical protein
MRDEPVATAGSCFAQRIGPQLREAGFAYIDVEPAPPLLRPEHHRLFGYGLFSARYGNIYTAAQLRQLLDRALGRFTPGVRVWRSEGRYYDPFRQSIEPGGFVSEFEAMESQRSHLGTVLEMFRLARVFMFSLGLTEAWRDAEDGAVYPACPGTVVGRFDAARHEFVNYDFVDVLRDLRAFLATVRAVNPAIRVVLTVSPQAITATNSGDHALVANTYTKAVLRAAAGQVARENAFVDYFPAYELIVGAPSLGRFWDANQRTISQAGVDAVMASFFRDFCERDDQTDALSPGLAATTGSATGVPADDDVCEDIVLESLAR